MNKKIGLLVVFLVGFSAFVVAQNFLQVSVVNVAGCAETDSGLDYLTSGAISGFFYGGGNNTNRWQYNETFVDACLYTNSTNATSHILIEGVCGSSINQRMANLAAAVYVDCKTLNQTNLTGLCVSGRCI